MNLFFSNGGSKLVYIIKFRLDSYPHNSCFARMPFIVELVNISHAFPLIKP